jgi:hypothetical protein
MPNILITSSATYEQDFYKALLESKLDCQCVFAEDADQVIFSVKNTPIDLLILKLNCFYECVETIGSEMKRSGVILLQTHEVHWDLARPRLIDEYMDELFYYPIDPSDINKFVDIARNLLTKYGRSGKAR